MSVWGKVIGGAAGFALGGPLGAMMGVMAGSFYDKYGPRPLIISGFTILTICTFLLCFLKADTSYMYLIIILSP